MTAGKCLAGGAVSNRQARGLRGVGLPPRLRAARPGRLGPGTHPHPRGIWRGCRKPSFCSFHGLLSHLPPLPPPPSAQSEFVIPPILPTHGGRRKKRGGTTGKWPCENNKAMGKRDMPQREAAHDQGRRAAPSMRRKMTDRGTPGAQRRETKIPGSGADCQQASGEPGQNPRDSRRPRLYGSQAARRGQATASNAAGRTAFIQFFHD